MALSKKALQRKREKKNKKRQTKVVKPFSSAISYSNWPVYECWVPTELWETGIGQVIITRRNNQGEIAVGLYLLDVFCLGIKDCFVRLANVTDYQIMLDQVRKSCGEIQRVEPVYANTLIYQAAEYAKQFGFKPHNDFAKAQNLLKNIPLDDDHEFSFGRDGKPYYVQGPHESRGDIKRILKTLESGVGKENYHFLLEITEPSLLLELQPEN